MRSASRLVAVSSLLLTSVMISTSPAAAFSCPSSWGIVTTADPSGTYNSLDRVDLLTSSDGWTVGQADAPAEHALILRWNGSSWSPTPAATFASGTDALLGVLDLSPTNAWAAGFQMPTGGNDKALIEHWDGGSWTTSTARAVAGWSADVGGLSASRATDVWAVGGKIRPVSPYRAKTFAMHWNGGSWSVVATPNPSHSAKNRLDDVAAIGPHDAWAVGYRFAGGHYRTLVEHWDGSSWTVVPSPNVGTRDTELRGIHAVSPTNIWAVGHFSSSSSTWRNLIEHWNGTKWSVVRSPSPTPGDTSLDAIDGISPTDIWAVGFGFSSGDLSEETITLHYNGTSWTRVTSADAGTFAGLYGVSAVPGMEMATGLSRTGSVISTLAEVRC